MGEIHRISKIQTPAQVEPYVRVLGVDGAIEFLLKFGGAELYFSPNPRRKSELTDLVGLEKAARLAVAAETMPRRIPTAKPWIASVWRSKGLTVTKIARNLHSSDVAVRGWLKKSGIKPPDDHKQPRLI